MNQVRTNSRLQMDESADYPEEFKAIRKLWVGVIAQANLDAIGKFDHTVRSGGRDYKLETTKENLKGLKRSIRNEARRWIMSDTFSELCETINIDFNRIRREVRQGVLA